MTGFELDRDEILRTQNQLTRLRDELDGYLRLAKAELAHPLPDGDSPVAKKMRQVYLDRADVDGGVQAVLQDYIEELDEIQRAMRASLHAYDQAELTALQVVQTAGLQRVS